MAKVNVYLTFPRTTEEAFNFYKCVFGTEFTDKRILRFKDVPALSEMLPVPESDTNLVMHVSLPILGGHVLMGSDAPESISSEVSFGNNVSICLSTDTRGELRRLFGALSEGGRVEHEMQEMSWGDYYGCCKDKFGVQWMFICPGEDKNLKTSLRSDIIS